MRLMTHRFGRFGWCVLFYTDENRNPVFGMQHFMGRWVLILFRRVFTR